MKPVFADAYYFIALLNELDNDHDRVVEIAGNLRIGMVSTEYIFVEIADALSGQRHRASFASFVTHSKASPLITIIPASEDLFHAGLHLYDARPDKQWSLTDCISFEVMRRRKLTDALTADHHFTQAGFRILL